MPDSPWSRRSPSFFFSPLRRWLARVRSKSFEIKSCNKKEALSYRMQLFSDERWERNKICYFPLILRVSCECNHLQMSSCYLISRKLSAKSWSSQKLDFLGYAKFTNFSVACLPRLFFFDTRDMRMKRGKNKRKHLNPLQIHHNHQGITRKNVAALCTFFWRRHPWLERLCRKGFDHSLLEYVWMRAYSSRLWFWPSSFIVLGRSWENRVVYRCI